MSDPVTNVDLDDVLSSIRRLVADRDPPQRPVLSVAADAAAIDTLPVDALPLDAPPADDRADDPAGEPAAETFLLTPALRVAEDAAPPRAPTLLFPGRPAAEPAVESGLVARLAARLEAAVTREAAEFEPDGSEDDPVIDWSAPMLGEPPVFRSRQADAANAPGPVRMILPLSDDGDDADAPLREAIEAAAPATPPDPVPTFHHRELAVPPPVAPEAEAESDLSSDLARASADLRADAAPVALMLADGMTLDEDMLRHLITEIVRQELQGTLGERITRNVRKLVRREIFKVLSSQELE